MIWKLNKPQQILLSSEWWKCLYPCVGKKSEEIIAEFFLFTKNISYCLEVYLIVILIFIIEVMISLIKTTKNTYITMIMN
jgi:hypothetical protein